MLEIVAVVVGVLLTSVCTIIGFFIVRTLRHMDGSMEAMTESVNALNVEMSGVVKELKYQRRDIDNQAEEIRDIKKHVFGVPI